MKLEAILSFVLAILEGGLAGACFCRAGQEEEKKPKILLYIASAAWFVLSVMDGMRGAEELKEAKFIETNGGDDND